MLNEEKYTLTLKRREICNLMKACTIVQDHTTYRGQEWVTIDVLHKELERQLKIQDEELKRIRTPKIGSWYKNGETLYKVLKACTGEDGGAYWVRSEAGWICKAWNAEIDGDCIIKWSHSTNGFWEGDNLDD